MKQPYFNFIYLTIIAMEHLGCLYLKCHYLSLNRAVQTRSGFGNEYWTRVYQPIFIWRQGGDCFNFGIYDVLL